MTRTGALINGALIAAGTIAVVDNIVAHWVLDLHRAVPGSKAGIVEVFLIVLGVLLVAAGLWRERRARRSEDPATRPRQLR